jgi:hypothetical protein
MHIKVVHASALGQMMTYFIHLFIPVMLNDAYSASQGAGFSSQMMQHMCL